MIEMQIAVAIENPVLLDAFAKQVLTHHIELVRVMADCLEGGGRNCFANKWLDLREIFVGADL